MSLVKALANVGWLRRLIMPLARALSFDLRVAHPWVPGVRYRLNSFAHKGYWFSGKDRERRSMEMFAALIAPGDRVIEVGGHIGFIALYYMQLVGPTGSVVVFEPGSNNLPYLRPNLADAGRLPALGPVTLIEKAVGRENGEVTLFEDKLTGQNNSILEDFAGLSANAAEAGVTAQTDARLVAMVTLDDFVGEDRIDFVKIDVEGAEFDVLLGMRRILHEQRPIIMVETWVGDPGYDDLLTFFSALGYELYHERGIRIQRTAELDGNIFCLHGVRHRAVIDRLFGATSSHAEHALLPVAELH